MVILFSCLIPFPLLPLPIMKTFVSKYRRSSPFIIQIHLAVLQSSACDITIHHQWLHYRCRQHQAAFKLGGGRGRCLVNGAESGGWLVNNVVAANLWHWGRQNCGVWNVAPDQVCLSKLEGVVEGDLGCPSSWNGGCVPPINLFPHRSCLPSGVWDWDENPWDLKYPGGGGGACLCSSQLSRWVWWGCLSLAAQLGSKREGWQRPLWGWTAFPSSAVKCECKLEISNTVSQ